MRLCVTKFSPTGFSASKGFQRNLFFCSNETTACVCSELCSLKKNNKSWKKTIEKNLVRRDLWRSFSPCSTQTRQRRDCDGASFRARRTQGPHRRALRPCPAPSSLPSSQLLWHSVCSCSPSPGQTLSLPIRYGWSLYFLPS